MTAAPSTTALDMVAAIRAKRDGGVLDDATIDAVIEGYVDGRVPDYQMSALLMAIVWRGLTAGETLRLTQAMVASGDTLDPGAALGRRIVDKHSTGGVGDKVSLALAPIVAACGVPLGKMSGRGLGHTGGTLDKLESIPGFTVELEEERFVAQVRELGVAIAGQTGDLVPADKSLYALRDVTGTVESIPLIAASIMSKKLAGGADAIVLDVKVGSGAFMKEIEQARLLADEMIAIGTGAGREVRVLITDMSRPLGRTVGNAIEIQEVVELLEGGGPDDLRELVFTSAGLLLSLSDLDIDEAEGQRRAREAVTNGAALARWREWIAAQGGDPDATLELAPVEHVVLAAEGGVISELDALTVGLAAARLGAGRQTKDDDVDHAVGIRLHATVGDHIAVGDPLLTIYARTEAAAQEAAGAVLARTAVTPGAPGGDGVRAPASVILERRG
ncbi:MAG: pyrimidine-nucleoside phosphorylase [Thermoleophilia bacterium]|nr:pyrimidine-nucleoside phosphorylase [Thermoleophilia bacterium]